MKRGACLLAALFFLGLASAHAAEDGQWSRGEGAHFIVYAKASDETLRKTVLDLDTYHEVLNHETGLQTQADAPKLEIYLVNGYDDFKIACPEVNERIGGFYTAESEIVAAIALSSDRDLGGAKPLEVLFHEYAHHHMLQNSSLAYPTWYVEGFAEYFAPTNIKDDGVEIGVIPNYRAKGLVYGKWLPLETILFGTHWTLSGADASQFYGESWLLTHYLFQADERRKKLQRYLERLNDGVPPLTAFREAFGMEVDALDAELRAYLEELRVYLKDGKMAYPVLPRHELSNSSAVTVTRLSPAYDALLLLDFRQRTALNPRTGEDALARIRKGAAQYPRDSFAQRVLARAEIFLGNPSTGLSRANAALAAAPNDPDWLYMKGIALLKLGYQDESRRAQLYTGGRRALARALKIRPNHVPTLYRYARSFFGEPGEPSDQTTDILFRATQLAPQIQELAITTSYALMVRNDFPTATRLLKGVANAPHGGPLSEKARVLLEAAEHNELPQSTSYYLAH